jgi:hypothetical protein
MTINIDIQNNPLVLKYFNSKFERMGWNVHANTAFGNSFWTDLKHQTPHYFRINLEEKSFSWWGSEADGYEDIISTVEDAQALMRFVEANQGAFVVPPVTKDLTKEYNDFLLDNDIMTVDTTPAPTTLSLSAKFYEEIKKMSQKYNTIFQTAQHPPKKTSAKDYPHWADMDEHVKDIQLKLDDEVLSKFIKSMKTTENTAVVSQHESPVFWKSTFSKLYHK